jgi:hypothetical protein
MVPILEVLEDLVPQKNLAGLENVLVPPDFAEIASTNVEEVGAPIFGNLLALKLQDLDKISLQLLPQDPPSGQVMNSHRKLTLKVKSLHFCNLDR